MDPSDEPTLAVHARPNGTRGSQPEEPTVSYDPRRHHRRSIRWHGYDYGRVGAYFVTICTRHRAPVLGDIVDDKVRLSGAGEVVRELWGALPSRFQSVELDAFVVMPNHIHGIIVLMPGLPGIEAKDIGGRVSHEGRASPARTSGSDRSYDGPNDWASLPVASSPVRAGLALPSFGSPRLHRQTTLATVVGAFKSLSAIAGNRALGQSGLSFWHRNYFDRVIRDDAELDRIRYYIEQNPANWHRDPERVPEDRP